VLGLLATLLVPAFIYIYSKMWEAIGPGLCLKRARAADRPYSFQFKKPSTRPLIMRKRISRRRSRR